MASHSSHQGGGGGGGMGLHAQPTEGVNTIQGLVVDHVSKIPLLSVHYFEYCM